MPRSAAVKVQDVEKTNSFWKIGESFHCPTCEEIWSNVFLFDQHMESTHKTFPTFIDSTCISNRITVRRRQRNLKEQEGSVQVFSLATIAHRSLKLKPGDKITLENSTYNFLVVSAVLRQLRRSSYNSITRRCTCMAAQVVVWFLQPLNNWKSTKLFITWS